MVIMSILDFILRNVTIYKAQFDSFFQISQYREFYFSRTKKTKTRLNYVTASIKRKLARLLNHCLFFESSLLGNC